MSDTSRQRRLLHAKARPCSLKEAQDMCMEMRSNCGPLMPQHQADNLQKVATGLADWELCNQGQVPEPRPLGSLGLNMLLEPQGTGDLVGADSLTGWWGEGTVAAATQNGLDQMDAEELPKGKKKQSKGANADQGGQAEPDSTGGKDKGKRTGKGKVSKESHEAGGAGSQQGQPTAVEPQQLPTGSGKSAKKAKLGSVGGTVAAAAPVAQPAGSSGAKSGKKASAGSVDGAPTAAAASQEQSAKKRKAEGAPAADEPAAPALVGEKSAKKRKAAVDETGVVAGEKSVKKHKEKADEAATAAAVAGEKSAKKLKQGREETAPGQASATAKAGGKSIEKKSKEKDKGKQ